MREILFRGKCIDETCLKGRWLEGQMLHDGVSGKYYIHRDNCLNESDNVGEEGLLRFVAYEVDPETVCQYTGLTDKNGRKIFEGDIVKIPLFKPDTMAIGFIEGAFCLVNEKKEYVADIHYIHHAGVNQTEIIGNIFDNPELIGDQP